MSKSTPISYQNLIVKFKIKTNRIILSEENQGNDQLPVYLHRRLNAEVENNDYLL